MISISYDKNNQHFDHLSFRFPRIAREWLRLLHKQGAENIRVVIE